MNEIEFPEVFCTGIIPENKTDRELCADALAAWGIIAGQLIDHIPHTFGEGMTAISVRLGYISVMPDSIIAYATEKGWLEPEIKIIKQ
jgi:hypothetical protein